MPFTSFVWKIVMQGGIFLLVLAGGAYRTAAQPVLILNRFAANWPNVDLYFNVICGGRPADSINRSNILLQENGSDIREFELSCPDKHKRCPISVAIVLDASGGMSQLERSTAIAAGEDFVNSMDGFTDEAVVLWFSSNVTVGQHMTTEKALLRTAIDSLPARDLSALWDGTYAGIENLVNSGTNPCRAVIVISESDDNSSRWRPEHIIELALRNRVRVFTIDVNNGYPSDLLTKISDTTGGLYYKATSPDQAPAISKKIYSMISDGFRECLLTYEARCPNGTIRNVKLAMQNMCGGSDSITKSYRALNDTSLFRAMHIRLGSDTLRGKKEALIHLQLMDTMRNGILHRAVFEIRFDRQRLRFERISAHAGSVLEGVPIQITNSQAGVAIETREARNLSVGMVPATLAELEFAILAEVEKDTIRYPIGLENWVFQDGCFHPVLHDGEILALPEVPELTCRIPDVPVITWTRAAGDYAPKEFPISMIAANTGSRPARNARFKIEYDPEALELVSPLVPLQAGYPPDIVASGESGAQWIVRALPRKYRDSITVCIVSAFDNHDSLRCCKRIWIPPAETAFSLRLSVPEISAVPDSGYNPMPFEISVMVGNIGKLASDTISALLILEPDLRLYGSDSTGLLEKRLTPATLSPNETGRAKWSVWHNLTAVRKEYVVAVHVKESGVAAAYDRTNVVIPELGSSMLSPVCRTPISLQFDPHTGKHEPEIFEVSLSCVNRGNAEGWNAMGTISLPEGVVLSDSTENFRKPFHDPIPIWKPGDSLQSVSWNLRYVGHPRNDDILSFRFSLDAKTASGMPLETVESWCATHVPGGSVRVIVTGPENVCEGDTCVYSCQLSPGVHPTWVVSGGRFLSGQGGTTARVVWDNPPEGVITMEAVDPAPRDTARGWIYVAVEPSPHPLITILGESEICEGERVTLDAGASFSSYIWSSGEATRTIEVGRSGLYFVKVTNAAGCEGISDSVRITVHPPPPVPLIKRAGDTLFTTARATSYRWMLDGSEISGAVFSRIVIALPGLYTVTITDSNGCSSKSAPYILTDADAAQSGLYSPILEAYPQPGETFIAIRVGNISPCEHLLILSDVLGRSVLRRRYAAGRANIDDTFDISRLPKGFYHLRISGGRDVAATKIMIK